MIAALVKLREIIVFDSQCFEKLEKWVRDDTEKIRGKEIEEKIKTQF